MSLDCKVSYRANVLLLKFNEEMCIIGPASALDPTNYAIDDGNYVTVLPTETWTEKIDVTSIRLKLPYYVASYLKQGNAINIGYINRKFIKYIESILGEVYSICNEKVLGTEVPQVNFSNGYGYLDGTNCIKYKYTGENEFYSVYYGDFYATINGAIKKPISVEKVKEDELLFIFENGTFSNTDLIYLVVYDAPKSTDIYGLPIKGNLTLKIRTTPKPSLETVSLSYINNSIDNKAYLMLMFDESIKYFYPDDFAAIYEGRLYPLVYTGNNYLNRKAFEVYIDLEIPTSLPMKRITLFTNVPDEDIRTVNYEDIPINPVIQNIAQEYTVNNLTWNIDDNSLKLSVIDIYFENQVDCKTLITNSNFDSTVIPWDGTPLLIPKNSIEFTKGQNIDVISLNFNSSFGKINIVSKSGTSFISDNLTNNEPATMTATGNKVSIEFSPTESAAVRPMTIDTFNYEGTKLIMNKTNYFLFYSVKALGILLTKNTIFVPPLNDESENPFKGGYQNPNYILSVSNSKPYRTYGNPNILTVVGGYVRVEGALDSGQDVILTNLQILGIPYIDISNGNAILDKINAHDVIYY